MNLTGSSVLRVSVVVPCYNASRTIRSCIRALKSQTVAPHEIIVADDGSSDDSASLAEQEGAKVIRLPSNRGAAAARNAGAKEATGEIILFVDSDVTLRADAVEFLVRRFETDRDIHAVIGMYSPVPPDEGFVSTLHNLFTCYNHSREEGRIEWFWGAIGAVRREIFQKVGGFDESFSGANAEDIELGWRMAKAGFNCVIDKSVLGDHHVGYTFFKALKNDFKKGSYALLFYAKYNRALEMRHGFSRLRNNLSLITAGLCVAALLAAPLFGMSAAAVMLGAMVIFFLVNLGYFGYVQSNRGTFFALLGAPVYFSFFVAIGFGLLWGMVQLKDRGKQC